MKPQERDESGNIAGQRKSRPQMIQQRRSSRRVSSRDRHGKVFEQIDQATIRAVTPETTTPRTDSFSGPPVQSPVLQPTRTRHSQKRRETSASASNTEEESTIERRRRRTQTRASTNEEAADASPGSFISKTRKRLGSIATGLPLPVLPADEVRAHGSIGFPSVVQTPDFMEQYNPPRTPRRPFSPDDSFATSANSLRSPTLLDIDSAKILHLMKTTCGRMHGILFFRPLHTTAWASGYCAINVAPGSLVCQTKGEVHHAKSLIPDLRGCTVRTHYDQETQSTYLSVLIASSGTGYQLRPPVPETFDSWLAALLCWQPLRPKGIHNKMTKPQSISMSEKRPVSQRRLSDLTNPKATAIVKVGTMLLWDGPLPSGSQLESSPTSLGRSMTEEHYLWRRVSCTLHEGGSFRLLSEVDNRVLSVTPLSQLSRCAVQRLDDSVLRMPHCIAIYPQYRVEAPMVRLSRPMVLCLESNVALEAWFVLLRALTVPELYGPEKIPAEDGRTPSKPSTNGDSASTQGMFRIERSVTVKITEAKFAQQFTPSDTYDYSSKTKDKSAKAGQSKEGVYAEVVLGKDLRARTTTKPTVSPAFWAEEFNLKDVPAALSKITIAVKLANPAEKEWTMVADSLYDISADAGYLSGLGGLEISSHDPIFGRVDVAFDELEHVGTIDQWWPLLDNNEHSIGQLLAKVSLRETVVLMEDDYKELSTLLNNYGNGLTTQIAHLLGPELRELSDLLLDLFQASGTANEWINNLVEDEIDGIYKDTPPMRMRFSGRIHSNDSYESAEQREMLVRDLSRSATMEANLLFRGNSVITKVLDSHMRRLGKDYMEEVLGEKLRKIVERAPECEVDPNRVKSQEQLEKNWANLIFLTNEVWKSIHASASRCPMDLRVVLRHVRSCAEDRYGSFIRTVKYTSVSGFLFLRFFCPAILNPKLHGLIHDHPPDRTKRTFTLIAKSLNVLASLGRFGTKEPWMEPMNKFLAASTNQFRLFVDEICSVSSSQIASAKLEPQYAAPNQIRSRLPALSREGLPSLPFLLDRAKLLAQVTELWVRHAPENISDATDDEAVKAFHHICLKISAKSKECLKAAEQAERPDERSEHTWQRLVTDQQKPIPVNNSFDDPMMRPHRHSGITALPLTADAITDADHRNPELSPIVAGEGDTTPSSSQSQWERRIPFPHRAPESNSSTEALDMVEEARRPPQPSSRDGPSKLFHLMSSSSRRRGRAGADDEGHEI
ncbi:GTPase activating factor [Cladophialophora chaetospira]|uniref:GTPase activating factor n=1 Tax=Cladophialophora chaetospira TaxID=386627 RepID=A0AA39CD50_9EURO|nr:GTPase activating factor [Cladophialophora chaetospira]